MGEKVWPLAFLSFRKQLLSTVNFVCTMWCLAGAAQWALLGCLCCCYLFIYCTQLSAVAERDGGSEQSVKASPVCHVVTLFSLCDLIRRNKSAFISATHNSKVHHTKESKSPCS